MLCCLAPTCQFIPSEHCIPIGSCMPPLVAWCPTSRTRLEIYEARRKHRGTYRVRQRNIKASTADLNDGFFLRRGCGSCGNPNRTTVTSRFFSLITYINDLARRKKRFKWDWCFLKTRYGPKQVLLLIRQIRAEDWFSRNSNLEVPDVPHEWLAMLSMQLLHLNKCLFIPTEFRN